MRHLPLALTTLLLTTACSNPDSQAAEHDHAHDTALTAAPNDTSLPPDEAGALPRLNASPRHGEYVTLARSENDSLRVWVAYPERKDKAPVVIVVQEIFGLSPWIRSVADQLASEGFIAIAPDFLSGLNVPGAPDSISRQDGMAATTKLNMTNVMRDIDVAAKYGTSLPAAQNAFGIVGFCWGGAVSFAYAAHSPNVKAAVVYYGTSLDPAKVASVKAPILGLYGGDDARVNSTIPPTDSAMKAQGKVFEHYIYDGAGHGFLRQQGGANGANLIASQKAWPATVEWFRRHLTP